MIKKKKGFKLILLSAISLLLILLFSIDLTNAWFTYGSGIKIECIVSIGDINMNVYQVNANNSETKINTVEENSAAGTKSYVDLTNGENSREIKPDTSYTLKLKLKNEDSGVYSYYVRYKIELLMCGKNSSTSINATFSGYEEENSLIHNGGDGYFYYGTSATDLMPFNKETSIYLCQGFEIPYSEFYNNNYNGQILKLKITIECSDTTTFN